MVGPLLFERKISSQSIRFIKIKTGLSIQLIQSNPVLQVQLNEKDYFRYLKFMPFYPLITFCLPVLSVRILFQMSSFQGKKHQIGLFYIHKEA